jgi:putative transposase
MVHSLFGNRRSLRLPEYDYRFGTFFFTLVTHDRTPALGRIANRVLELSEEGRIVEEEWLRTPVIRREVTLDEWTIMPEHFHAIVFIHADTANEIGNVGGACWRPCPTNGTTNPAHPNQNNVERIRSIQPASHSLARMINQFKATTTRRINDLRGTPGQPVWQRNYDERIIRNTVQLDKYRQYIRRQVSDWVGGGE